MKESYLVHEYFIREDEEIAILVSEHENVKGEKGSNAKIEIDLPEFHIELFMPEDLLKMLAEKAQQFLGKKEEEVRNQTESEEVSVHTKG